MGEIFTADQVRGLRTKKKFQVDGSFSVVDELEVTNHLLHVLSLACDSIEDIQDRNAFVSLISEIELRIGVCSDYIKDLKQKAT